MRRERRIFAFCSAVVLFSAGPLWAGAEEGEKIFDAKKCMTCHSLGKEKGAMAQLGGPLDGVGSKRDAAWLKSYLPDPKSKIPDAKMPKQTLTDKELEDVVEYMLDLK